MILISIKKTIVLNEESFANYNNISNDHIYMIDDLKISFEDNKSHTIESYMIKIQNKNFTIVYTSDVGISNFNKLIKLCNNADLIICESSLLKKYTSNCKTHLTAYDAGILAKKANAKRLVLTHFWPEEKKENYLNESTTFFNNTEIAEEEKKQFLIINITTYIIIINKYTIINYSFIIIY